MLPKPGETIAMGVKARVLRGRLLTDDDYNVLLGCDSIAMAADVLRETEGYREPMSALPPHLHRIELEGAVRNSILDEAEGFLPYLVGARRAFFVSWLDWYEVENIKSIFRWIRSRRLDRDQMRQRLYAVPGSKVSHDLLLAGGSLEEAHEALRGTKYYDQTAAAVKKLTEGEESLFSLELAFDNLCETQLYRNLHRLDPDEYALLKPYFGSRVDLLNLCNLLRCLLYYRMPIEETLSRLLPVKHSIKTRHLRDIAKRATWDERLERLESISAIYGEIFRNSLEKPSFELSLEMSTKRLGYFRALAVLHSGSPGFHTAMAYFLLKSYEIDDVIRIIEDVRYDYDRRSAAQYLTRPIKVTGGEPAWR